MHLQKTYKIAVVNGDGIGSEIVPAGVSVLDAIAKKHGFSLEKESFPYGAGYYRDYGKFMADDALEKLKQFDAIYFGNVSFSQPILLYIFKEQSIVQIERTSVIIMCDGNSKLYTFVILKSFLRITRKISHSVCRERHE